MAPPRLPHAIDISANHAGLTRQNPNKIVARRSLAVEEQMLTETMQRHTTETNAHPGKHHITLLLTTAIANKGTITPVMR